MSKLNTPAAKRPARASRSPLRTTNTPALTHEGGHGAAFDTKSALFFMGAGSFYGEDTFYEKANARNERYAQLAVDVAATDPQWFSEFTQWLRNDGNIRTAAIVAAAEGAYSMTQASKPELVYQTVRNVLVRPDEIREFTAYWRANLSRNMPRNVRRALRDAATAMITERNVIKWDGGQGSYVFADIIELVHPAPRGEWQAALFKYLLDERHHGDGDLGNLPKLDAYKKNQAWLANNRDEALDHFLNNPQALYDSGMTWENLSSSGPMHAKAWESIIPAMGYMALIRNLRNFDEAGVDEAAKQTVAARLADPEQVARSRQLPYRFLSAYLNAPNAIWHYPLEQALQHCLPNIPVLDGKTVVLVDTSSSMENRVSGKSKISYVMAGALFGVSLAAAQGNAILAGFANAENIFTHPVPKGGSVLRTAEQFCQRIGEDGHGTNIRGATEWAYQTHPDVARIVVVTDGQCHFGGVSNGPAWNSHYLTEVGPSSTVPASVPIYAFNVAGYATTAIESTATRHQLGGFTDATFGLIKTIEAAQTGQWPWESQAAEVVDVPGVDEFLDNPEATGSNWRTPPVR